MNDLPRLSGFTLIERPWGREVQNTPEDTPEQLAQLFAHLERSRIQVPDVLKRLLVQNVAPVSVLLLEGNLVAAGETERAGVVESSRDANSSGEEAAKRAPAIQGSPSAARRVEKWLSEVIEEFRVFKVRTKAWKNDQASGTSTEADLAF